MTLDQFHNALRILTALDLHELLDAGVIETTNDASIDEAWKRFRLDPFRYFIRASDAQVQALWGLMVARMRDAESFTSGLKNASE